MLAGEVDSLIFRCRTGKQAAGERAGDRPAGSGRGGVHGSTWSGRKTRYNGAATARPTRPIPLRLPLSKLFLLAAAAPAGVHICCSETNNTM